MALEIARLGGVDLPLPPDAASLGAVASSAASSAAARPLAVHVIAAAPGPGTSAAVASALAEVLGDLKAALLALGGGGRAVELVDDAAAADRVVVLLTAGTLVEGSASLSAFAAALATGGPSEDKTGLLVLVHLPPGSGLDDGAAFDFGGAEVRAAPAEVRSALYCHEALAFRPRVDRHREAMRAAAAGLTAAVGASLGASGAGSSGGGCGGKAEAGVAAAGAVSHEWSAMARQLGVMLGRCELSVTRKRGPAVAPASDVHLAVAAAEEDKAAAVAVAAEEDKAAAVAAAAEEDKAAFHRKSGF